MTDYRPNYQSSPSRRKAPTTVNREQPNIYKYSIPSDTITTQLYNNSNSNIHQQHNYSGSSSSSNNNTSNNSSNYENLKHYTTNRNKPVLQEQQQNQQQSSYSVNNNYSNNNDSYDDIEDDVDVNYSSNTSNRYNDDSHIDYSTDDNPSKKSIKPPQPIYNHLNNQIQQQQQQHQQQQQQQNYNNTSTTTTTNTTFTKNSNISNTRNTASSRNSNNNSIISKFIIQPWNRFYYKNNKYLWPFEGNQNGNVGYNFKQIVWIFIFSSLFLCGILGLFATTYHGINVYFPFSSSPSLLNNSTNSNNNNNIPLSNLITKEQLYPFIDEYIKKNEIFKSYNKLFEGIENRIKELSEKDQYSKVIKEIREEVNLIKLSNMDEERVNQLINKMVNHYNNNENNKKELSELLLTSIKELKSVQEETNSRMGVKVANYIESIKSTSNLELEKLEKEFESKFTQFSKKSDSLLLEKSNKLSELSSELSIINNGNIQELSKEYTQLSNNLNEFSNKLKESINTQSSTILDSSKKSLIKEINEKVEKESNRLQTQYVEINQQFQKIQQYIQQNPSIQSISTTLSSLESIKQLIDDILEVYSADKIAKADYALILAGASIEYNSPYYKISETYPTTKAIEDNGGGAFKYYQLATNWIFPQPKPNPPETILDPLVNTGSCWGFYGGNGTVVIKLAKRIVITEVTMEHINPNISHNIQSAPKDFQVFGLLNSTDIGHLLGTFSYDITINRHLQTYKVDQPTTTEEENESTTPLEFSHVALRVLSNHGHRYTCLYRFRVHGVQIPHPEEEQLIVKQIEEQQHHQEEIEKEKEKEIKQIEEEL